MKDVSSERFLLSSIAQNGNSIFTEVSDIVDENCFSEENKFIYKVLSRGLEQNDKIDITNFMSICKDLGYEKILSGKNNIEFIKSLFNAKVISENSKQFAIKLRKLNIIQNLQKQFTESYSRLDTLTGNEDIEDILNIAEAPITNTHIDLGVKINKPEKLFTDLDEYYKFLENNPVDNPGISTGFHYYDEYILGGGLRRKYVNMLVSRPKGGKSAFLIRIAKYIACVLNIPVLYLDTELEKAETANRILSAETTIKYRELETGQFKDSTKKDLVYKFINQNKNKPLYYMNIPGKEFTEILSIIKRWIKSSVGSTNGVTNDCVVIYDYFKLMNTNDLSNMSEHQSIGYQLQKLCDFVKINDVACLSACQANRDGISKESTDVVAGSDRIAWFCSSLCLLRKKSAEEISEDGHENGNRKLFPLDALRFSEGLPDQHWINYSFDNFNFKEINVGPTSCE